MSKRKSPEIQRFSISGDYNKSLFRGRWRIRTAVDGFADRCLTTRPTDPKGGCKDNQKSVSQTTHLRISFYSISIEFRNTIIYYMQFM